MTTKETKTSQTKGEPNSYEEAQLQINELQLKLAKKDETILELNKTIKQKQDEIEEARKQLRGAMEWLIPEVMEANQEADAAEARLAEVEAAAKAWCLD